MRARRGVEVERLLCSGPGRVGQALEIVHAFNGRSLAKKPFTLLPAMAPVDVVHGPRIGISKAMDLPWRFGLAGSPFLSKPFR
jgi:DNA-3-methyladenine glycosylase